MSHYLFKVQEKNRLKQKGILKRFSIDCYGKHHTIEGIRAEKAEMFKTLNKMKIKSGQKYEWHFLKYTPGKKRDTKKTKKRPKKRIKKRPKKRRKKRSRKLLNLF